MNFSTLIVGTLVFGLISAAILKIIKDHKSGKSCGCAECCDCKNVSPRQRV